MQKEDSETNRTWRLVYAQPLEKEENRTEARMFLKICEALASNPVFHQVFKNRQPFSETKVTFNLVANLII